MDIGLGFKKMYNNSTTAKLIYYLIHILYTFQPVVVSLEDQKKICSCYSSFLWICQRLHVEVRKTNILKSHK